ncbi:MAG TPA: spermidine/putrescine ABC transporter ATP-binding protein [Flavobacteriales bacterium]|nr:spermidine/putrescine ABC transporter ATP-binding protein [Flavobacteriales bacterium]HCA83448.1 spermidine/putrescine ABC transporter ATP-binding protein [Flavobacteriales bacterium]
MKMEIDKLSYSYKEGNHAVLNTVSFCIEDSFFSLGIAGRSGSGKTTLLKAIYGLLNIRSGQVRFNGERVEGPDQHLIPGHPKMKLIAQDFALLPDHTVEENIYTRLLAYTPEFRRAKADRLLQLCKIDHLRKEKPSALSGGQQQMLAISCALAEEPELLLLDEPFSHLDKLTQSEIMQYLRELREELGFSFIFVSHDAPDVLEVCDRILIMEKGKILEQGDPLSLYFSPKHEYTAALFGMYNKVGKQFIRPSSLRVTTEAHALFSGKVADSGFRGESWWIKVRSGKKEMIYLSLNPPPAIGKLVHLKW